MAEKKGMKGVGSICFLVSALAAALFLLGEIEAFALTDLNAEYLASTSAATCYCPSNLVATQMLGADPVVFVCRSLQAPYSIAGQVNCSSTPVAGTTTTNSNSTTAIATDVATSTTETIINTATVTKATQLDTIESAANISGKGASNRGTIGAVECADGANSELESTGSGTDSVAACQDDLAKAKALAEMAGKGGGSGKLNMDQGVMESADVRGILSKFEKNFGISGDDYVSRMLLARDSANELKDMLGSKFTDDKFEKMMAVAGDVVPEKMAEKESGITTDVPAKKTLDTSLRDSLKKKLLAISSERSPASADNRSAPSLFNKISNLKPGGLDQIINGSQEQETELTLFDIVRLKYRECTARHHLN